MYKHTEERPHQCSLCNFATVEHDKLLIHLRNHTGESPYKCDTCGMTFKTPISYKRHVVTHTGWRQYLCHLCLKKFGAPASVKEHIFRTHGVTKNNLDKVRNVKEHGMPSLLAKFVEGKQLNESETKMVNCLKYYEILESAADDLEITNMDFSILENEIADKIVDKSPFFMLKSKDAVQFLPTKVDKEEWIQIEPVMEKQTMTRKRRSGRKKIKTEYRENNEPKVAELAFSSESQDISSTSNSQATEEEQDIDHSNAVKVMDTELPTNDAVIQTERKGLKRNRGRHNNGTTEAETKTEEMNENCSNYCEESFEKPVELQANVIPEQDEPEIKRLRVEDKTDEIGQKSVSGTEEQETERKQPGLDALSGIKLGETAAVESSQTLPIEGGSCTAETGDQEVVANYAKGIKEIDEKVDESFANKCAENRQDSNSSESDEDETETSEGSIFLQQTRKSLSLKTPKLNCQVNDSESFKTAKKPITRVSNVAPTTNASSVSSYQDVKSFSNETVKVADYSNVQGRDDETIVEEEIPLPTSFVSVVSDITTDGKMIAEDSESETSEESLDSNVFKGGPPKSLPPFISLERCSDEHKERLLTGMKKGVFGPTPSVIRVLEDGSMINVSNLYKAYLPPST